MSGFFVPLQSETAKGLTFGKVFVLILNMTRSSFIQQHASLFWYTPSDQKNDVSDSLLVETILNYGTLDDYRSLLQVLTPHHVAEVFFSASERQVQNYYPPIRHYFSLVLKKYV